MRLAMLSTAKELSPTPSFATAAAALRVKPAENMER